MKRKIFSLVGLFFILGTLSITSNHEAKAGEIKERWKNAGLCAFPGSSCLVYKYGDGTKIKVY